MLGPTKTTYHGEMFERQMSNEKNLQRLGFLPHKGGLAKTVGATQYLYLKKGPFYKFCLSELGAEPLVRRRKPDEAYLTIKDNQVTVKILEMKNQNVPGSVDLKLYAGGGIRHEYRHWLRKSRNAIAVEYAFCVCNYLKNNCYDKIPAMSEYLKSESIPVFFGEQPGYFDTLNDWAFGDKHFIDA